MAPLSRRPFKALKDQIQEVQINQKAASGKNKIYTDSESISQKRWTIRHKKVRAARKIRVEIGSGLYRQKIM